MLQLWSRWGIWMVSVTAANPNLITDPSNSNRTDPTSDVVWDDKTVWDQQKSVFVLVWLKRSGLLRSWSCGTGLILVLVCCSWSGLAEMVLLSVLSPILVFMVFYQRHCCPSCPQQERCQVWRVLVTAAIAWTALLHNSKFFPQWTSV